MKERRIRAQWDSFRDCGELALFDYDTHERRVAAIATSVTFQAVEDRFREKRWEPVLLQQPALQALFDDLWAMGLRPKDFASEGVIEAMKQHIADLRRSHITLLERAPIMLPEQRR